MTAGELLHSRERQLRRRKVEIRQLRQRIGYLDRALADLEQVLDEPDPVRRRLQVAAAVKADVDSRWGRVQARERAARSVWSWRERLRVM